MDIVAPVTDYMAASVLTTQGDIVQRGAAAVERRAIGTANQIMRVNAGATDIEYIEENAVLTTQGDIMRRGAAGPERMAIGGPEKVLTVNAAGNGLLWAYPNRLVYTSRLSATIAGGLNIPDAATTITTIDMGTVKNGSMYVVEGYYRGTKGGVTGMSTIGIVKNSGTGNIICFHDRTAHDISFRHTANDLLKCDISVMVRINATGTFVIKLWGKSAGSDITLINNEGKLSIYSLYIAP